ncbi:uncharacterized protein LOC106138399 isoform X2 [Amyelois transitella]|uniref:uncharacterized protein LOC106138399 isoform X2 n=1 Tax=Amyelois transitella TaxID=680683 RepID=UPI00067B934B|nr:uncharacterized protein LOC106138399 isoform X2 [Amyelois transitella]
MDGLFHKCRLCLKLGDFCSIYEQDESIKLSEMVMSFAGVQIYEGDGLPDRVCSTCIENLSTAYLFKQQCERIDSVLRKSPEAPIVQPNITDYNDLFNQEFHMHSIYGSIEGDNDQNSVKDANAPENSVENNQDVSEDTDSDIDSVKCVYCNEHHNNLAHICHVKCTVENNQMQRSSSNETLVASDADPIKPIFPDDKAAVFVACVLCDEKYDQYDDYVLHINKCTTNVKMRHFVCPICHEIFSDKLLYLDHLRAYHFKQSKPPLPMDPGVDCVDSFTAIYSQARKPKLVRRQIGWSVEDIYQEIDCAKPEEQQTATSSPFKNLFSKLGNESFSRQSTPKKVSFRNFIESSKAKTTNYFPFRKYIENYKQKKRNSAYSPIKDGKLQVSSKIRLSMPEPASDSDYNSPSGTSEESWRMKQNLICACDKKIFMLSEFIHDRDRIGAMINELGGVVAENTKMEMLATHFISVLPNDTFTGMMVCALATGKWLLHVSYIYDSFRCKKFMRENIYEWMKHPKILEIDSTSVEVAKAAVFWHLELQALSAKFPFEGKQIVLIMKKKYRQYYHMIFKALKAKPVTYDPRTPGSCCSADYCFVDMKIIERVKLRFFARHNVPVFPYQYILVYLLKKGRVDDEHKYLLQECKRYPQGATIDFLNNTC